MQNKYQVPPDVRETVIRIVKGYNRRKRKLAEREHDILALDGVRFESSGDERAYTPSGKGGASSPTETKAMRLAKLHESFDARCVRAIDDALNALPISHYPKELADKIRSTIIVSCAIGRKFKFRYSGIVGIEARYFYQLRSMAIYSIAKKLELI